MASFVLVDEVVERLWTFQSWSVRQADSKCRGIVGNKKEK
jgi:hypothetical protein